MFELRFGGGRKGSLAERYYREMKDDDYGITPFDTSFRGHDVATVLKSATEIAGTIEPGERFEISLGSLAVSATDELEIGLAMEASNHDLLVVGIGEQAVQFQVCLGSNCSDPESTLPG